jgi:hypothetical protein
MKKQRGLNMRLLILVLLFVSPLAQAQVWSNVNSWNDQWEQKYTDWVRAKWTADFFARRTTPDGRPNIYYGLTHDCADTVYSMRAIFSYENGLPFVINDSTGGSGTISNSMSRFNRSSSQQAKIRLFLEFLNSMVSTHTLPNDTYPVAVTRKSVHAGGLMMATAVNHHSWTIKDILPIGVPWLIYNSRVGAASGYDLKERQSWPNPAWVFQGDQTPAGNAGFRYWKPVSLIHEPAWQIPGYSEEQYRVPLKNWRAWAQKRLALQTESNQAMIDRLTKTVCDGLQYRLDAVNEAIQYIHQNPHCMNYDTYDTYSTPNRDERIFDDMVALRAAYRDIVAGLQTDSLTPMTVKQMEKIFPYSQLTMREETSRMTPQIVDEYSVCQIEYAQDRKMDLSEAKRRMFLGLFSNNPMDEIQYRWGESKGSSPLAKKCQSWDPWHPNLNQD